MIAAHTSDLTVAERRSLLAEVHEALGLEAREVLQKAEAQPGGLAGLDRHVEELVPIVRRSTATKIEPYLAQIQDDICPHCPQQQPSAFCSMRHEGNCVFYRYAGTIVAAVRRALCEIDIGRGLEARKE
jgi:hypothetical protein